MSHISMALSRMSFGSRLSSLYARMRRTREALSRIESTVRGSIGPGKLKILLRNKEPGTTQRTLALRLLIEAGYHSKKY
jgi:hypothetical protein